MTGSAPQPGDTQPPTSAPPSSEPAGNTTLNPWHAPGPDRTWWHGQAADAPAYDSQTAELAAVPPEDSPTEAEPVGLPEAVARTEPEVTPAVDPAASATERDPTPEPAGETVAVALATPVPNPASPTDDQPFWMPGGESDGGTAWPPPQMRAGRSRNGYHPGPVPSTARSARREPRRPALALAALVVLSLLATFFAWVTAEPLWLAVGHGDTGTATVSRCTGTGVGQRCVGAFAATDGRFTADRVALLGVAEHERQEGAAVNASMVDRDSRQAYVGTDGFALHLRWALGLALVLLCGAGIVWATGATRLENRRARRWAVLGSLGGPLLMTAGFLAAAF